MRLEPLPPLLKLAGPLILSSSSIPVMQLIDALLLARHSSEAIAAIGPSSLALILFHGLMFGAAGYAGTFVAHNHGRDDAGGVLASAWLGIHTALFLGALALAIAWPGAQVFGLVGHDPEVARGEGVYLLICMAGSVFPVLASALAGWLARIGRTMIVAWVTIAALAVNVILDWELILGDGGLPRPGRAFRSGPICSDHGAASLRWTLRGYAAFSGPLSILAVTSEKASTDALPEWHSPRFSGRSHLCYIFNVLNRKGSKEKRKCSLSGNYDLSRGFYE